jgi:hypothetical protein
MRQAGHQKATMERLNKVHSCCPIYVYLTDTHQLTFPQGEAGVQSPAGIWHHRCCGGWISPIRHVAPDQALFEPEYFIALMEDGPSLFNLIGQCFQDIGLTKWNKVTGKQCPDDTNLAKVSFKE